MSERLAIDKTPERKEQNRHLIIGLHGAIGAGKTELASLLSRELGLVHFQEKYEDNPYLENFYREPAKYSFQMESFFIKSKIIQMGIISEFAKKEGVILDPTDWQDTGIYARVHYELGWMTSDQYQQYLTFYDDLCRTNGVLKADLVVTVEATVETIYRRIRERARPYEMLMLNQHPDYFALIAQRTEQWARENSHKVPIIPVNSDTYNYVVNSAAQALIIKNLQLEITRIFGDHPDIKIPQELIYIRPNFGHSVGRSYLRH